ncbi:hypothetical protein SAMN06273572_101998 [Monaibacterium marinum]|uniref:Uncharacterized protein n=1 Tax=Pontivivens marinum TaxID=1690039 RepID=A0A2C9CPJ5_9RHOB|nr:hypothetical protein [Monaibacterium marinum]SOH93143.1 hypothetical protein SAMN06273572_101998 [Monaibacterium marinum]
MRRRTFLSFAAAKLAMPAQAQVEQRAALRGYMARPRLIVTCLLCENAADWRDPETGFVSHVRLTDATFGRA